MHNVKHQPDRGSADKTTQLDPCDIKSELPVEHGQTHHICIPRSKPTIHTNSPNEPESKYQHFFLCSSRFFKIK